MSEHYEVRCPPVGQRSIATVVMGVQSPITRFEWGCPVCTFRVSELERSVAQQLVDAHSCNCGWCPITYPVNVKRPNWGPLKPYVSPARAKKYARDASHAGR